MNYIMLALKQAQARLKKFPQIRPLMALILGYQVISKCVIKNDGSKSRSKVSYFEIKGKRSYMPLLQPLKRPLNIIPAFPPQKRLLDTFNWFSCLKYEKNRISYRCYSSKYLRIFCKTENGSSMIEKERNFFPSSLFLF